MQRIFLGSLAMEGLRGKGKQLEEGYMKVSPTSLGQLAA